MGDIIIRAIATIEENCIPSLRFTSALCLEVELSIAIAKDPEIKGVSTRAKVMKNWYFPKESGV